MKYNLLNHEITLKSTNQNTNEEQFILLLLIVSNKVLYKKLQHYISGQTMLIWEFVNLQNCKFDEGTYFRMMVKSCVMLMNQRQTVIKAEAVIYEDSKHIMILCCYLKISAIMLIQEWCNSIQYVMNNIDFLTTKVLINKWLVNNSFNN